MDLKVFNDDCLNVLKTLEDNSVDCVVTDPPYRIIAGGVKIVVLGDECGGMVSKRDYSKTDPKGVLTRGTTYVVSDGTPCSNKWIKKDGNVPSTVKSGKMFENNEIKFSEWLSEIYRIVKPGTHTYIMINSRNLKELWVEAEKVGFKFQNLLVWSKGNCLGGQTELFIKNKNEGKTELINFEKLYNTFKKGIYQVLSDNGKTWIDIVDCFKNSSEEVNIKEIVFENGTKLKATEEHIFYQNGKEILVKNLKVGDIVDGINNNFKIAEINEGKSVIYDLSVNSENHKYCIGDGIITHNCTPNRYYMQGAEFILMLKKGPSKNINNMGSKNVIEHIKNPVGKKNHPTEKPVDLYKFLLENSTNKGDTVLDPFAGCGNIITAGKELGLNVIAIEIDKEYFDKFPIKK